MKTNLSEFTLEQLELMLSGIERIHSEALEAITQMEKHELQFLYAYVSAERRKEDASQCRVKLIEAIQDKKDEQKVLDN